MQDVEGGREGGRRWTKEGGCKMLSFQPYSFYSQGARLISKT